MLGSLLTSGARERGQAETQMTTALALQRFLLNIPASEPHHVCLTGNRAHRLMQSYVLPEGQQLEDFKMESKLDPHNQCIVKDLAVGNTLFLVVDKILDRCAA